jgi:pimeloyl-ACP methyl ester carboxylesterase
MDDCNKKNKWQEAIMKYKHFTVAADGFAGHMAEPEENAVQAVIIVMGGEKSLMPGIKIAERFADYKIAGLAVSLFGADGLPKGPDRIPIDMFEAVVYYLKETRKFARVSIYGMSMGAVVAALVARNIPRIDNLIMVSPSHVPFEGTLDKKHMTGHSFVTWRKEEIPYVKPDFSKNKAMKYSYDARARRNVMGMWSDYMDAYEDREREKQAEIHLEKTNARILMIAGTGDEAWPSDYSVRYLKEYLEHVGYTKAYKAVFYTNASHLLGMMPNREREKWLYRMIPVIGLAYRQFLTHKKECMQALEQSEMEIIHWLEEVG